LLLDKRREYTPNNSDIFGPLAGRRLPMSWELPENLSLADRKRYYGDCPVEKRIPEGKSPSDSNYKGRVRH